MPSVTTGLGRIRLQVFSGLGGFQDSLTWKTCLQRQQCMVIKGIIWLIQSSLTHHQQLVILRRCGFICTYVHLSTHHTKRVLAVSEFWDCIYIYYSNRLSMVVILWGIDKCGSKHIGSHTNINVNVGGTYKRIITDGVYIQEGTAGVYIQEGKDMRMQRYEDSTFE